MDERNNDLTGSPFTGTSAPDTGGDYVPKHEKPPEARQPVYDEFMYEPIGFEEFERAQREADAAAAAKEEKRRLTRSERTATAMLALLILMCGAFAVYGLIRDLAMSSRSVMQTRTKNVVLYQNSKPEGANDISNWVDENGRYTVEGAAAAVKPSIVEIYTYSDASHKDLLGTGSGIVLTEDGYILTNAHVLSSSGYHVIATDDGERYDAKIVGRDAKTDIAVISVTGANLTPAILGNSDEAVVGEEVIAIGNPARFSGTVTNGIVSAVNRKIRSDATGFEMNCIQTNAELSPGNSGGALVNMYGQVIGITSSKYISSDIEGIGFAISINDALPIIEELISNGYISGRFRIGVKYLDTETESKRMAIAAELGIKELPKDFRGLYITSIDEEFDIADTELRVGDFITAINGKQVGNYQELYDAISSNYGPGDVVPATCARFDSDGEVSYFDIEFVLAEDTSGDF
ncbi:MAG: trypsin-like peptidase domain-containing protein [Ruminococcus sp.]|nr:trypsin-like peptidase domain-containing protein [Ruminococcus sp.]